MPYIGNTPAEKYAAFNVQNFTTSATTSYTLDRAVANELDIRLVINNVIQQPGAGKAYTASGTTLTLSGATSGGDTMYAVYIGKAVQTVNPGAGSVGTTALADNAVTNAKLADATQGDVIYYGAAGAPAQLSAGTNGHFLKTQGAGANPVWAAVAAGVSLTGSTNNTVATVTGANALAGEANLQFDGTNLGIGKSPSRTLDMESNGDYFINLNDGTNASVGSTNRGVNLYAGGSIPMYLTSSRVGIINAPDLGTGLHIKTADTGASAHANADELVIEGTRSGLTILCATEDEGSIYFGDSGDNDQGQIVYNQQVSYMKFVVNAAERMRMLSGGEIIINRDSTFFGGNILQIVGKSDAEVVAIAVATNGKKAIQFANAGLSDVGNIVTSSSSVAYNTSSDYRLKENETPITDGITRLKTLKPYRFNWLADNDENGNPTQTVDGFFAHEVTAVPEAINGTKDAMHPEVLYKDEVLYTAEDELPEGMNIGDTKTPADELPEGKNFGDVKEVAKPNHQSIDQSKLVPLLVASLQEAITKIETLEARITTLENA